MIRRAGAIAESVVDKIEEGAILAVVMRQHHGASNVYAKLVLAIDGGGRRDESTSVEFVVAKVFKKRSVELIGAAFGAENLDAAAAVTIFGAEVGRLQFELTHRFDGRDGEHDASALDPGGHDSIEQHLFRALLGAVNIGRAGAPDDPWSEHNKRFRTAHVTAYRKRKIVDLLGIDHRTKIGRAAFDQRRRAGDLDGLIDRADLQREFQGQGLSDINTDALAGELAKALGFRDDVIGAERETPKSVISGPAGGGVALDSGSLVRDADRRACDHRIARIGNPADDDAQVLLGQGGHNHDRKKTKADGVDNSAHIGPLLSVELRERIVECVQSCCRKWRDSPNVFPS